VSSGWKLTEQRDNLQQSVMLCVDHVVKTQRSDWKCRTGRWLYATGQCD